MNSFWIWWQHLPEKMSPVIFEIGWFSLKYYGLMYIIAFVITYGLVLYRVRNEERFNVSGDDVQNLMLFIIIGVIAGGRFGYVLFYNLSYYLSNPLEIFLPFQFSNGTITFTGISGLASSMYAFKALITALFKGIFLAGLLFLVGIDRLPGTDSRSVSAIFIPANSEIVTPVWSKVSIIA